MSQTPGSPDPVPVVGDEIELEVGPVAHGGHCIARWGEEGLVIFVRHSLPGERVQARITEIGSGGRFLRADAVRVIEAAPERVQAPCPFSGPGQCGGCDFQHVDLAAQRLLKAEVVMEQLVRLGGFDPDEVGPIVCEALPGDQDGLRWRTRVEVAVVHRAGRGPVSGLRAHRSHRVVPVDDCRIAHPGVLETGGFERPEELIAQAPVPDSRITALDLVAPSRGEPVVVPLAMPAPRRDRHGRRRSGGRVTPRPAGSVPQVTEQVGEREFTLSARGFWQVHPGSARVFTDQVMQWLAPQPGERALDLYAGVGLFAVPLAEAVGQGGGVLAVESDRDAVAAAQRHLSAYPWAEAVAERTEDVLHRLVTDEGGPARRMDLVVLDPPRSGAGATVIRALDALAPRAVVYVACDPAALARDLATARTLGWELAQLRVLDAFPMTHHVECLALLVPGRASLT